MKRKIKKYLFMLIAAAALFGGMRMPLVVKAQEDVHQTETARAAEGMGVTVTNHDELMAALAGKKSPITVQGDFTISSGADTDGRMLPIKIPGNTVIQGTGDARITSRSPIQLEGDGVCFQNIKLVFNSSDELHSVPHREIFLAGYSLTLDNVRTYLPGGTILNGTEEELLPTVYAGGYTNTSIGGNASLTVRNSNDETMFKAIYMGHDQGYDNKKPYNGNAVLNLDAKVTVRENIETFGNSEAAINISGEANQAAQAKKFYGDANTTLTVDSPLIENAVLDNIGNVVLRNGACLSPETESLCNVTLQDGACLDLNGVHNAVITGDFTGETDAAKEKGILVLNREGRLQINGWITGTTQFQTEHRNTPGILLPDRAYIIADHAKATEANFVLAQKSIENGYELKYSDGVWKTDPLILREIGRIEILSAPSEVDLAKISLYGEEKISEGDPYFEVKWYDKEGNIFDDSEIEDKLFYEIGHVLCIRTEYWEKNTEDILQKNDWLQWVTLSPLEGYSGRYYIQKYDNMATTGDYTFLFLSSPYELEQLDTVADVKALQNEVMAERRVTFYNGDTGETEKPEPEKPEHTHSYQSAVTKTATCTEKGIRTYTCSCGNTYTESIEAAGHKPVTDPAVAPTETTAGKTEGSHCSVCKEVLKKQEVIPALGKPEHTHSYQSAVTKTATCTEKGIRTYTCSCGNRYIEELALLSHKYVSKVFPATVKKNGKIQQSCQVCSAAGSASVIYKPRKLTLNKTDFSYDGKVKTPSVTVKDSQGNSLRKGTDYQIKYPKGRKNPGVYSVAIVLQGNYSGKMTGSFTIRPKKTSLKKVAAKSKGMQVTWNKQAAQIDGYQIQYCTSAKFKGKTLKAVTVKKNSTVKKISKLAGKKKYYVRIRTYKTVKVNGKSKKLYSDWSGKKAVNTKK